MTDTRALWGTLKDGREVYLYTLSAGSIEVIITEFGARVVSIKVPDRTGCVRDVCLGYDCLSSYEEDGQMFGAIVGRAANRVAGGTFTIKGNKYQLEKNEGVNHAHGGSGTFTRKLWETEEYTDRSVTLSLVSPDGEAGYPGTLTATVKYSVSDSDELIIEYRAESDSDTICNLTNHTYFNLDGQGSGKVYDHFLKINSERYAEAFNGGIPKGTLTEVKGTPLDFTVSKRIGQDISACFDQLMLGGIQGYDNPFEIKGDGGVCAELYSPGSGIKMEVMTDSPSLMLYTANFLNGEKGRGGAVYGMHDAVCLEAQFFPDAINHDIFKSPVVAPDKPWEGRTVYRFSVIDG